MKTSPSPPRMACAAVATACSPEPHSRLTVWPATLTGRPLSNTAMRATFRLSSPAWLPQPKMTSSMLWGSRWLRRTSSWITSAARSSGRTSFRTPPYRPTGVRTASMITGSGILPRLVGEESAAGGASGPSGLNHPLQQWRGPVRVFPTLIVYTLDDGQHHVESDLVGQRQRTVRVIGSQPHRGVDLLRGGHLLLEGEGRLVDYHSEYAREHPAGAVPHDRRLLP